MKRQRERQRKERITSERYKDVNQQEDDRKGKGEKGMERRSVTDRENDSLKYTNGKG